MGDCSILCFITVHMVISQDRGSNAVGDRIIKFEVSNSDVVSYHAVHITCATSSLCDISLPNFLLVHIKIMQIFHFHCPLTRRGKLAYDLFTYISLILSGNFTIPQKFRFNQM